MDRRSDACGRRVAGIGLLLLGACGLEPAVERPLTVVRFRQADQEGVFLNEPLVVHFDRALDPVSVHPESARVVDGEGARVRGRFEVERGRLRFLPEPPRAADLTDGGFRPGTDYRLELRGFPLPDGLRALDGRPLGAAWTGRFRVAEIDPLFDDPTLGRAAPVVIETLVIDVGEPVRLRCVEPLDPRSVAASRFELRRLTDEPRGAGGSEDAFDSVALHAELVANTDGGALVELWPVVNRAEPSVRRRLDPGPAQLWVDPASPPLVDLGGNRAPLAWSTGVDAIGDVEIVGEERELSAQSHLFEFLDDGARSPEQPESGDGTAHWSDSGQVTIRLPRAVGDGADGPVTWTGPTELTRGALSATRLVVDAEGDVTLPAGGLVVLRSQRDLRIDGRLVRRSLPEARSWREGEDPREWRGRFEREGGAVEVPPLDVREDESLSDWLERAEAADPAWTVLVAGGDLVIEGELRTDGPLVLVAGGRIRAGGRVSATEIWRSDPGGFSDAFPSPQALPVVIDAPVFDPLVVPLSVSVLSDPFRPGDGQPVRWLGARVADDSGDGRVRVRYLGERLDEQGRWRVLGPVDDPGLLTDSPNVRLLLELELEPGGASRKWRPPRIDAVELFWESAESRR